VKESDVQRALLARLGQISAWVTVWRNNCGVARRGTRVVRFGIPGQADISGLISPLGRRLEIEVKRSRKDRLSPDQISFRDEILRLGGAYFVCRGPTEIDTTVDAVIALVAYAQE
jgi:hypothetical protein